MEGREFLDSAQRMSQGTIEADWRTAAGRAYYAVLLEGRTALQNWGYTCPRRDQLHAFIRLHFIYPNDPDLRTIGYELDDLVRLRNQADYQVDIPGPFVDATRSQQAIQQAWDLITLLDDIKKDATRQATSIAAIQQAFPP